MTQEYCNKCEVRHHYEGLIWKCGRRVCISCVVEQQNKDKAKRSLLSMEEWLGQEIEDIPLNQKEFDFLRNDQKSRDCLKYLIAKGISWKTYHVYEEIYKRDR